MINKRFEELLRINNRQDFESKFLINGDSSCAFLRTKDGDFECECPWIKRCNPKDGLHGMLGKCNTKLKI